MTINELNYMLELSKHMWKLHEQIKQLENNPKELVADTVGDYRTGRKKIVKVEGYGSSKVVRLRAKYAIEINEFYELRSKLEDWLDTIDRPRLRTIARLRYARGYTIESIADEMDLCDGTIKRAMRELKKYTSD